MVRKSILSKFLFVLAPIYLTLVLVGSVIAAQILIRDTTDVLTARVGGLAARVSIALDMHEAYFYSTLANDLIAPLGVDPAVLCVEFKANNSTEVISTHPPQIGCRGQEDAPFQTAIDVDDFGDYQLFLKFTDAEITNAVSRQIAITAGILTFAFIITLISAAIGFRTIVSTRLLALHGAIRMAADNLKRQRVKTTGQDELTEIINAYNSLMDQDDVRERQLTAANEILSIQSRQDPLTGLYNRRFFSSLVKKEMSTNTTPNAPGAMMLLDIDHFKQVNDNFG
ncbi:MAG: GGDEF domain-containing protein, partial [Pseudomonadota bacterium]